MKKQLLKKLKKIKLVIFDVDGVLTDGKIVIGSDKTEYKNFNVRDGTGVTLGHYAGLIFAIISGRYSEVITIRAKELGIKYVYQNVIEKIKAYEHLKKRIGLKDEEICFLGDEVIDIPIMEKCGFSAAPSDCIKEIKPYADYICKNKGGEGCAREVIDLIIKARGLWKKTLSLYLRRHEK
ncbi:MAG: HAD hydrolase family protein [Candidatus Goldbacteria bacterium]|nr:HAD hydrolase family protein [Candidatus Goldiibacteriota bacterium]